MNDADLKSPHPRDLQQQPHATPNMIAISLIKAAALISCACERNAAAAIAAAMALTGTAP
jgi:hypothetical protein